MFPLVVSTLRTATETTPRAVIQSENPTKTSDRRPWGCLVSIRAGRRRVRSGRQPVVKPPLHRERTRRSRQSGAKEGHVRRPLLQTGPHGSATVTILCRPIREVRVARPRVRPDRLGAHASGGGGFDETARQGVTCEDPAPVRSRPRWSRRIPTRIAHGIGHDHAWVFMDSIGNKAVNPKLAESAPNSPATGGGFAARGALGYWAVGENCWSDLRERVRDRRDAAGASSRASEHPQAAARGGRRLQPRAAVAAADRRGHAAEPSGPGCDGGLASISRVG